MIFEDGLVGDVPRRHSASSRQRAKHVNYQRQGYKLAMVMEEKSIREVISWQERRQAMQGVCRSCHGTNHIDNFYRQFDDYVKLYNAKFGLPGQALVSELMKDGIWKNTGFQNKLGYTWFEIWHHEGRRGRHGAAHDGTGLFPLHGLYEIARNFYHEFIPEALELAKRRARARNITGWSRSCTINRNISGFIPAAAPRP